MWRLQDFTTGLCFGGSSVNFLEFRKGCVGVGVSFSWKLERKYGDSMSVLGIYVLAVSASSFLVALQTSIYTS